MATHRRIVEQVLKGLEVERTPINEEIAEIRRAPEDLLRVGQRFRQIRTLRRSHGGETIDISTSGRNLTIGSIETNLGSRVHLTQESWRRSGDTRGTDSLGWK